MDVLVVEDDALVARGIVRLLKALGYTPRHVSTLEAAKEDVSGNVPNAVIADLGLAGNDQGLELLGWLAENYPAVRRVLTSGGACPYAFTPDFRQQWFLAKPFGAADLTEALGAATSGPANP